MFILLDQFLIMYINNVNGEKTNCFYKLNNVLEFIIAACYLGARSLSPANFGCRRRPKMRDSVTLYSEHCVTL